MTVSSSDRVLDRLVEFDERSKNFRIRTVIRTTDRPRTQSWDCKKHFDQGREGACVGFGWTHEAVSRPVVIDATQEDAFDIYYVARRNDQWPGEDYDGTSVIAGAKAMQQRGWLFEYRWAFGLDDFILALSHKGPAVLGVNWYTGMFRPDENGFIYPTGKVEGGHCVLAKGIKLKKNPGMFYTLHGTAAIDLDKSYATLHQSWGIDHGIGGDVRISLRGVDKLLKEDGEVCIPVRRRQ